MTDFHCDSYCGLYCGSCDMFQAHRRALEKGGTATWDGINFPLKKQMASAPVICHGCKTDVVFKGCQMCPIRKCAREMADIETCLDCRRYPCLRYKLVDLIRWIAGMNRKLPHLTEIPRNLPVIREKGLAVWLEEQKKLWTCPDCGASFSWYQRECHGCGRDVRALKRFQF